MMKMSAVVIILAIMLCLCDITIIAEERQPVRINSHLSSNNIVVVEEGHQVTLVCNVTGVPKPTVNWYRFPRGLLWPNESWQDSGRQDIGVSGEVLQLDYVARYDDDAYQCVANNGVPPAARHTIRVYVEFPPDVRLPNRRIMQRKGRTAILECVVTSYPHAITRWRHNGADIQRNSKHDLEVYDEEGNTMTLALRVRSLTEADYGQYQCVSQNQLGQVSQTMVLDEYPALEPTTTTTTTASTTTRGISIWYPNNNSGGDRNVNSNYTESNGQRQGEREGGPPHPYGEQSRATTSSSKWPLMAVMSTIVALALLS